MTVEELENSLPNGVHDGEISGISVDYVLRVATFEIDLWIGDLNSKDPVVRECYRKATITIRGLDFLAIEPPHPVYPYTEPDTVCISNNGPIDDRYGEKLSVLPKGNCSQALYIGSWNTCIFVSGESCDLKWTGEPHLLGEDETG